MNIFYRFLMLASLIVMASFSHANNGISLLSATEKDKAVGNVEIILQQQGKRSISRFSDDQGAVIIPEEFDSDETTAIFKKDGFSTFITKCPCNGLTYALSETMSSLDGIRIVLTWNNKVRDLDAHLLSSDVHINHRQKQTGSARLDVDDIEHWGPETITVDDVNLAKGTVYYVRDFVNSRTGEVRSLAKSEAKVDVYVGSTLIYRETIDENLAGNTWAVFRITDEGTIEDVNKVFGYAALFNSENSDFITSLIDDPEVTPEQIAEAKRLNTYGERLYREKRFDEAAGAFIEATQNYWRFGQAHSNLGITFIKLEKYSEALAANRAAIKYADGARAYRVMASSFYNMGKILEMQGLYERAKLAYQQSFELTSSDTYREAIDRMDAFITGRKIQRI
jgi:tetratricopeptide (TPR) repeat protein|tara:strand:- start:2162 stop:3346 length:1185 start_codon:yes stop_codon:yes gene_type:complete